MIQQNRGWNFSKRIKGRWFLLETNKNYVCELDETAGFIWELTEKPISEAKIVEKVVVKYQVDKETARNDVRRLVELFIKREFLDTVG